MDWFSQFNESGDLDITLRVAYPAKWLEDIPEYDRGFSDEMHSRVARSVRRFLYNEAFADEYTPLYMALPIYNSPMGVGDLPTGIAHGYILPVRGKPLALEIGKSSSLNGRDGTISVHIRPPGITKWTRDEAAKLFKPEFLALMNKTLEGGLQISDYPADHFRVAIVCPQDFPLETAKLSELSRPQRASSPKP